MPTLAEVYTGVSGTFKHGGTPAAAKEVKGWTIRAKIDNSKWASNDGAGWKRTSTRDPLSPLRLLRNKVQYFALTRAASDLRRFLPSWLAVF